jgi:hypothetical protein
MVAWKWIPPEDSHLRGEESFGFFSSTFIESLVITGGGVCPVRRHFYSGGWSYFKITVFTEGLLWTFTLHVWYHPFVLQM